MDIPLGRYKHYKGGIYQVIANALHSESHEPFVVYRSEYASAQYQSGTVWVRPSKMFFEEVDLKGEMIARFEKIEKI